MNYRYITAALCGTDCILSVDSVVLFSIWSVEEYKHSVLYSTVQRLAMLVLL